MACAQEVRLTTACQASFATFETARTILTNRDDFIRALSPFDRAARMKVDRDVPEAEFLAFVAQNIIPWTTAETNRVSAALLIVRQRLAPWNLALPSAIPLIKTTGKEEGNASYTRLNAVILPQREVKGRVSEDLLLHELFHVLSRHNPNLREQLYRVVGFTPINEISYPGNLGPRKITNPDGVQSGWAIQLTNHDQILSAVPILFASAARYDPNKGGEFFDYLTFKLLVVANQTGTWGAKLVENVPVLLDPQEAHGFFEQVGRNTDYIIHPDEILADNFVKMINGATNLATPRIVEKMTELLKER